MTLNINDLELVYLSDLLENAFIETMREENRTDTLAYKHELKDRIRLIDGLREKLTNLGRNVQTDQTDQTDQLDTDDNRLYRVKTIY
jgi:hypothetical protein